ncbi:glycosyltransferase family 2 protein [Brachybacterium sp.]|uniref:glycosyltransferase family 2 protein n=1 Tax=Brachybacterium sp. TaxID=1891286 RepID=UPI002ECFBBA8
MTPLVSVIIPVYNSEDYVREAVRSVHEQSLDAEAIELIAVDDGSTDSSGEILAELAAEDPRMNVLSQENSGTPGGGRNPGIDRATGEFLFFLDSDDRLTPDALRRMVEVATSEGSDVVLGKLGSSDGRKVPSTMFTRTVLDADLVRDKVFNTLGPTKLIRREIVERLGLRFPEDQGLGEDQPFMAAVYLSARKISILADMVYYVIRHRDDRSNMSLTRQSSASQCEIAQRVALTIEEHTAPGELRDALLKRPLGWSMERALDKRWLTLERAEQELLAGRFREQVGHLVTDGVRQVIGDDVRLKLELLLAGELDGLAELTAHLAEQPKGRITYRDGAFRRELPPTLTALLPAEALSVDAPTMKCRLEDVRIAGSRLEVSATVRIPDLATPPDELLLRARRRDDEKTEVDLRTIAQDLTAGTPSYAVSAEHDGLERGIWDLFVVIRCGEFAKQVRLGADRARTIEPEGVSNLVEDPAPQDRVIAYFTQGHGNLSIDRGGVMHRELLGARAVGLTLDENLRAVLLVSTTAPLGRHDEFFGHLDGVPHHSGRQLLPVTRLGERLIGLRLPLSDQMIGASLRVDASVDGAKVPLRAPGTEHWPARAAGFGLLADEEGTLHVTVPAESGRDRLPLPEIRAPRTRSRGTSGQSLRRRVVPAVKRLPVIGPVAARAVRAVRERRS